MAVFLLVLLVFETHPIYVQRSNLSCNHMDSIKDTRFHLDVEVRLSINGFELKSELKSPQLVILWNECIKRCLESCREIKEVVGQHETLKLKINYWFGTIESCELLGKTHFILVPVKLSVAEIEILNSSVNGGLKRLKELLAPEIDINFTDPHGRAPIHLAAQFGRIDIAKALLKKGANPFSKTSQGKSAVDLALENGHHQLAKLLSSGFGDK